MDGNTNISTTMAIITNMSSDTDLFVFEDYNLRISIATILCIVFLVGSIGNALVITAVVLSRKLRSSTNWFIVNLGCSDLLTCLCIPFNVVAMLSRDGWPLPGWICAANSAASFICLGASIMTLALIAYNRWYLLTRSVIHFQKFYTTRNICFMVLSAWMYPALLVLVPHFAGLGRLGYSYEYKACSQDTSLPNSDLYSLILGSCIIILFFIVVVFIYVRIYLFVSRQSKKMNQLKKAGAPQTRGINNVNIQMSSLEVSMKQNSPDNKEQPHLNKYNVTVTKRLAIVVLAFFICLLPFGVSVVVPSSDPGVPWTALMSTVNSCVNPLIYARTMPTFRKAMLAIICCRLKDIPEPIACVRRCR